MTLPSSPPSRRVDAPLGSHCLHHLPALTSRHVQLRVESASLSRLHCNVPRRISLHDATPPAPPLPPPQQQHQQEEEEQQVDSTAEPDDANAMTVSVPEMTSTHTSQPHEGAATAAPTMSRAVRRRLSQLMQRERKLRKTLVLEHQAAQDTLVRKAKISIASIAAFMQLRDARQDEQARVQHNTLRWTTWAVAERLRQLVQAEAEQRAAMLRREKAQRDALRRLFEYEAVPLLWASAVRRHAAAEHAWRRHYYREELREGLRMAPDFTPHYAAVVQCVFGTGKLDWVAHERCPFVYAEDCPFLTRPPPPVPAAPMTCRGNKGDDNAAVAPADTASRGATVRAGQHALPALPDSQTPRHVCVRQTVTERVPVADRTSEAIARRGANFMDDVARARLCGMLHRGHYAHSDFRILGDSRLHAMADLLADPSAPLAQDAATFLRELSELQAKSQARRHRLEQLRGEQTRLAATLTTAEACLLKAQWRRAQAAEEVLQAQVACADLAAATLECKRAMQDLLQRRQQVCEARKALISQGSTNAALEAADRDGSLSPPVPLSPLQRTVLVLRQHEAIYRHCFATLLDEVRQLHEASRAQHAPDASEGHDDAVHDISATLRCVRQAVPLSDDEYGLLEVLLRV